MAEKTHCLSNTTRLTNDALRNDTNKDLTNKSLTWLSFFLYDKNIGRYLKLASVRSK